ncbi:hypothetical protein DPMN_155567 [Dreissena polymorpha]|uniref:Uncharacterized protein n=1 Tax=Dreissena polymorpha TaxID=45954 RepID=A0A9D4J7Z4_DREPO|nr:hypothetical protein DPMN_155567 [Dreissena polymorpha]
MATVKRRRLGHVTRHAGFVCMPVLYSTVDKGHRQGRQKKLDGEYEKNGSSSICYSQQYTTDLTDERFVYFNSSSPTPSTPRRVRPRE